MYWKNGFYDEPIDGGVEITLEHWAELLEAQAKGYEIGNGEDGYPVLIEPGPKTLEQWRMAKLGEIMAHDGSEQVNRFYINKDAAWFNKATRSGLRDTLDAEEQAGKTTTTLWIGSEPARPVNLAISDARRMLADIEVYSKEVYDTTQRHRAAVYVLGTIDGLKEYDHTTGYPEILRF